MPDEPIECPWQVGDRVRHWSQQYTTEATGTVLEVKGPVTYRLGHRGWELLVQRDEAHKLFDANEPSWWPGGLTELICRPSENPPDDEGDYEFHDYFDGPVERAFCDGYEPHDPHYYGAINGNTYSCPGITAEQLAEAERVEREAGDCEHGLSALLCSGPHHYGEPGTPGWD